MKNLERILTRAESVVRAFAVGAGVASGALFLFILLAIASRIMLFRFEGQAEISTLLLAAIACLAFGYALLEGTHVRVDALISRLPSRWQTITESFVLLLVTGFFAILAWRTGEAAYIYWDRMIYTEGTILLPKWISSFLISLGCLVMVFALLIQFLRRSTGVTRGKT